MHCDRSFYVGDAAGRKSDHSAADIGFAQVGILAVILHSDDFLYYIILYFMLVKGKDANDVMHNTKVRAFWCSSLCMFNVYLQPPS